MNIEDNDYDDDDDHDDHHEKPLLKALLSELSERLIRMDGDPFRKLKTIIEGPLNLSAL